MCWLFISGGVAMERSNAANPSSTVQEMGGKMCGKINILNEKIDFVQ
jgi:hypothetical protein